MTARSEPSTDPSTDEVPLHFALEKCLEIFQTAEGDSEKFAALLMVTKVAKDVALDIGSKRRVFDAVGFAFPNRLLFSKLSLEGCPEYLLRSLGLTLLACFCSDPALASHPEFLNKIPVFNETVIALSQQEKRASSMVEDAYQCLMGILAAPGGIGHLLSGGTISSLCQAYLNQNLGWENALGVLTTLLTSMPGESWEKSGKELQLLLVKLSEEFNKKEDRRKFHLAEILPVFLPPSPVLTETSWGKDCLNHLCMGLFKVLRNKLTTSQRDPALKLGAFLSQVYGSSWILTEGKEKRKFFCLLVNLACVEVRMALEDPKPLTSRQAVSACYSLVEMGIQECAKEKADVPMLKEDQKLQLLQVMQEACGAVIYYLQQVGLEKHEDPFVLASVRLLGAWLAEETYRLKEEVIQLLPFLIHYMRTLFHRGVTCSAQPKEVSQAALLCSNWGTVWPGDAIRFLLPAMCHLSAEEAPRTILISEGVPALLCDYYGQQWEAFSNEDLSAEAKSEAELSMQSCCGVFLNLVVTEPTLFGGQENCFVTLLALLVQSLPVLLVNGGHMTLAANISTLGLMMSRLLAKTPALQEDTSRNFFKAAIQFLSRSHSSSKDSDAGKPHLMLCKEYSDAWADISELWFLGVQAFSACLPLFPWLSPLVLESGWLDSLLSLLGHVSPESVKFEMAKVLQGLFTELAQSNASCRELILQKGGKKLAKLYCMTALEQCLSEIM